MRCGKEYRDPKAVTTSDIRDYVAALQQNRAPKTVREAHLGLRRFIRFLVREGEIRRDPTSDMKLMRYRVDPQPTYSEAEVKRLLAACDPRTLREYATVHWSLCCLTSASERVSSCRWAHRIGSYGRWMLKARPAFAAVKFLFFIALMSQQDGGQ